MAFACAAAVAGLLAALLAAAPVAAQTDVWTATLTPADFGSGLLGCNNASATSKCSTATVLSDDDFTYDSTDYSVTTLYLNAAAFTLTVDTDITDATNALTVVVGSTSLAFADANTQTDRTTRTWFNPGFSWTAGTAVSIRIPDTTPPELTSAAVAADGNSITVTFDESVDQTNLPAAGAFSVAADGAPVTVSGVSAGTAAQLVLALAAPGIRAGQVVTLGYTDPTDGDDTSAVQDTSGNDAVSFSDYSVTNNSIVVTVPSDWSLKPTGLAVGAKFRLLFLSSTKRDGSSSDIATYNTFVQDRAAAGHADIRTYSTGFRAIGCTAAVDARDNTSTTGTGVPIYWLDGTKAADQYEDFYDGTWDDEANDKNESGTNGPNTSLEANYPLTGCNDGGTEYFDRSNRSSALAKIEVMVGRPNSSAAASHGPLSSNTALDVANTVSRPMYGLSALFQVVGEDTTPPTLTSADVEITDALIINLVFSEDLQLSNPPALSAFTVTVDGSAATVSSVGVPGSVLPQNELWLQLSTAIRQRQAVVVTYTDATSGDDTAAIQDTAGNDAATFTTGMDGVPAVTNNSTVTKTVPADWSLIPTGLSTGDKFRLLFLSSTKRNSTATDIATYNTFIQTRAAAGHTDIQDYSADFRAVGCTADTDARDNTKTTYTTTDKGVPIYWLNGAKAADQYEDFYDGSWDDEANDKNESGTDAHDTSQNVNWPWTGCDHDGTEAVTSGDSFALGTNLVDARVGRPNSSASGHGPLNGQTNRSNFQNSPLYGLSEVFQVAAAVVVPNNPPTVATAIPDQSATAGTAFSYAFPANTFSDADTGDTLSYTATKADGTALPTWLAFTAGTRTFSGTPQAADAGTVSVKVTASDGNGGSVSDTFDITVAADTTPPTLTSVEVLAFGNILQWRFSENLNVQPGNLPPFSAFTVTADGRALTTNTVVRIPGVVDGFLLQLSSPFILQGQTVVVTYTDPTAGDDANAIQDTAGNDAATFTTGMNGVPAVTNNSTVTNTPATGAPTITGTAQVGQTLTAGTTAIMDADGLTSVSYTYQWIRTATGVDTNISGATASTYTLVAADLGTTIKVRVSFTDDASNAETLTSAATAAVSANNPPTSSNKNLALNEDTELTFFASDFTFTDADGNSLSSVKILSLPATDKGTLTFSGMALTSGDLPQTVPAAQFNSLKYVPPANENGGEIPFTSFTFRVNDGTDDSAATYTLSLFVYRVNDAATGQPGITGTAQVGQTLAATAGTIADVDGLPDPFLTDTNTSFQWVRVTSGTDADISGARDSTYTLVADDEGKKIKVKVSFLDTEATTNQTEGPLTSAATATVSASTNTPATGAPTITGTAQVGQTLTAGTTAIMDDDGLTSVSYTYQWIRTAAGVDTNISSATASTYTLVAADLGTTVKVRVSFTDDASNAETLTSAATATVSASTNTPATGAPTITGTAQVGQTLTAGTTAIMDDDGLTSVSYTYQWIRVATDNTETNIASATASTYTLVAADLGTTVKVRVSFTDDASNAETLTSAATAAVSAAANTPATGAPTITGTAQVGQTLTAGTTAIMDADGLTSVSYTYQWIRVATDNTETNIASATASTYTLVAADQGTTIKVKVSFTDDASNAETLTSAATAAVSAAPNTLATGAPTITGTAQVGQTLTAGTTAIMDANGLTSVSYTYQWIRVATDNTETNIASATASTYTLVAADQGTTIKVKVSFTDDASNAETLTSAATAAVSAAANTLATGAPTITGTAQVGQTLTAGTTAIMDDDGLTSVSYTYQWIRVATDNTETNIASATASTYTLVAADQGTTIKVKVSFTDDASNAETLTSAATATVSAAANTLATGAPTITGTAQVGQTLTAGTTAIMDANGLTSVSYTYQWIRVATDNTETNIASATASTYTLVAADQGTTIKVKVSFTDDASNAETLTSAATATVSAAANTLATGAPTITGTAQVGQTLTAGTTAIMDANGLTSVSYTYQWIRVATDNTETNIASATASTYTLVAADQGTTIKVKVSFTDDASNAETLTSAATATVAAAVPNNPPAFSADTAARSVAENTAAGQNVGAALTATDADSDTLTYTLEGTDAASFDIVSGSGQIRTRTGVTYNHEAKSTHTVVVKADDGNGGTDTIAVTITVTDVDEPPGQPAAPSVSATAGSTTSLDVTWTAPTNTGPAIASYDLQYRAGTSGNFTNGPQNVTGTSAAIGSLAADTSYEVQVRATNAEGDGDWSVAGTGRTTATSAPGAPTGLTATASGATQIDLSWSAPASTGGSAITGYKIEVSPNGTSGWTDQVANTNSTATTYAHTGLASGDTRHYRVSAINANGAGTASNVDSATTLQVPAAVSNVVAVPVPRTTDSLQVSWSAPDNAGKPTLTGYDVRYREEDVNWTTVRQDAPSTSVIIAGLGSSNFYDVQVRALNADGSGPWSSTAEAATSPRAERVYANHPLIPADLGPGDAFRLLFITRGTTAATRTGIHTYHNFASTDAIHIVEAGNLVSEWGTISLLQTPLVSTPGADARLHTDTTWTETDRGMPIYWLNGARVADDYADFYDGVWADEANPTNGLGNPHSLAGTAPWTGTDHDGTELFNGTASRAIGQASVSVGGLGSTITGAGPLNGGVIFANTQERPIYGLWHVLVVDENLRLVTNFHQPSRDGSGIDERAAVRAQLFTTGPNSTGYGISSIEVVTGSDTNIFLGTVAIYTTDTDGNPDLADGLHATLSLERVINNYLWRLVAPEGTVLKPTTTYALVFLGDAGTYPEPWTIDSDGENVPADGWSLANTLLYHNGTSWVENPNGRSLQIEIVGPRLETEGPALVSATVGAAGNAVSLVFDEDVVLPSDSAEALTFLASLASAFAVTADGAGVAVSGLTAASANPEQLTIGLSGVILQGQAVTLTYTDPTAGDDAVALQDVLGNETPTFTTGLHGVPAVINNSAITVLTTTVPGAPTGLTATASGNTRINLSWSAPASDDGSAITGYKIEVSPNGTSSWTNLVANTSNTTTTYAHTGLTAGATRHYRVSAINTNGTGTASNVDSATTAAAGETTVTFTGSSYTASEGQGEKAITVELSAPPSAQVTIPLAVTHRGGATAADYSGPPSSLTFAAGRTRFTFGVKATDDSHADAGESVRIGFGTLPDGYAPGERPTATVTLEDNDDADLLLNFGTERHTTVQVLESDTVWHRFTLSLSTRSWGPPNGNPQQPVTIPLVVTHRGGATPADYEVRERRTLTSVTFGVGQSVTDFSMRAIPDGKREPGEGLRLDFGRLPAGVRKGTWGPYETIEFVDQVLPGYTVLFGAEAYTATEGGAPARVSIHLSEPVEIEPLVVRLVVTHVGATAADYTGIPKSVRFRVGEQTQTITVKATDDTDDDDGESVTLSLVNDPNGRVTTGNGPNSATVALEDNDGAARVTVSFGAVTYTATEGGDDATVRVELDAAPGRSVTVPLTKAHLGNATAADYSGIPMNVTFAANQTSRTFAVMATAGDGSDGGESVSIGFGTLPEGVFAGSPAATTVTLADGTEQRLVVDFGSSRGHTVQVREGARRLRLNVLLDSSPRRPVTIPLVVTHLGGATEADYAAIPESVTFAAGQTSAHYYVRALPDEEDETGEGLRLDFGPLPPGVRKGTWGPYETIAFVDAGQTANLSVAGPVLTLDYPWALDGGSTPSPRDFVVSVEAPGGEKAMAPVAAVAVRGSDVFLQLARPVAPDDTVTLSYLADAMHPIRDEAGSPAAPLTDAPVRNQTPASGLGPEAGLPVQAAIPAPMEALLEAAPDGAGSERLDLSSRNLTDLSALAGLTGLRELDLRHNAVEDLWPLAGLTGLRVLHLSGNRIADLSPLAGLTGLEQLSLAGNRIEDLAPLTGLAGLRALDLSGNRIEDFWPLAGLAALERLNLADNRVADLATLAQLTGLRELDLSGNRIEAIWPLAGLAALERLNLSDNRIEDLWPLAGLSDLQVLLLDRNRVSDLVALSQLPGLANLGLSGNRIVDIGLLSKIGRLRRLDLSGNAVANVSALGDVSGLVWLRLPGNPVSDVAPLGRLEKLRWLWLDSGTAAGMEALSSPASHGAAQLWIERTPAQ